NSLAAAGGGGGGGDGGGVPSGGSTTGSVVGWPPVSKAHRMPSLANQTKSPGEELVSIAEQNKKNNRTNGGKGYCNERKGVSVKKYQSVKVNMDGTLIGRKVDLNAYNGTSEFILTYQDKDGDCMLVGDVPWQY
ncbi:hypothetical protein Ccrd_003666, partial [Cynara cardunculus var. scolymus]